jgi:O-antigen ligase
MGFVIYAIIMFFILWIRLIWFLFKLLIAILVLAVSCLTGKPRWPYWIF